MCAERARSLVSESGSTTEKDGSGDEWWTFHILDWNERKHGCGRIKGVLACRVEPHKNENLQFATWYYYIPLLGTSSYYYGTR